MDEYDMLAEILEDLLIKVRQRQVFRVRVSTERDFVERFCESGEISHFEPTGECKLLIKYVDPVPEKGDGE